MENNYYLTEQVSHLQDFYDTKIKLKRGVQNILAQPLASQNPADAVEEMAVRLEQYEIIAEANPDYKVDLWCGYVDHTVLDVMLEAAKAGVWIKPPTVFDASLKVIIMTEAGPLEVHACDSVLIYNHESKSVGIGHGHSEILDDDISLMKPVIGISISDSTNKIYDIDYLEMI